LVEKYSKIAKEKFAGKEKMSTFALPLKNGRLVRLRVHLKD